MVCLYLKGESWRTVPSNEIRRECWRTAAGHTPAVAFTYRPNIATRVCALTTGYPETNKGVSYMLQTSVIEPPLKTFILG